MFLQPLAHRDYVLNIGGRYPRCLHLEFGLVSLFSLMIFQEFYFWAYSFWLHWVSVAELELLWGCGVQASHCGGFYCCGAWSPRRAGLIVVEYGLNYPKACRIFSDQGSNPCPLHWQVDSYPLDQQGSPSPVILQHSSLKDHCVDWTYETTYTILFGQLRKIFKVMNFMPFLFCSDSEA